MSSLADTPTWRPEISQAPRASLTIRMDAERDGAIPLADLAAIAKTVQETIDRIARSLNDRSGGGRPPAFLSKLSALEAVGIKSGSAVLEIEAPHDMDELPIEFGDSDAGVQAIELFVQSVDALSRNEDPPSEIGKTATKSLRAFVRAVESHEYIRVESKAGDVEMAASLVPRLIALPEAELSAVVRDTAESAAIVGTLYGVNLHTRRYRIEDGLGRTHLLRLAGDLDDQGVGSLLGGAVRVSVVAGDETGESSDPLVVTAIERVEPPESSDYFTWDLEKALKSVEPLRSIEDLAIPGLDGDEFDSFWRAVNE
ncbi:MAG: hypothetical protein U9N79_05990 [Actinomycetota bacterium]|nr:hypothetical protein [Actinomycetota bacterium]